MATLTTIRPPAGETPARPRRRRGRERPGIKGLRRSMRRHWTLYLLMVVPLLWFVTVLLANSWIPAPEWLP